MAELKSKLPTMALLRQAGLSELAYQFAQYVERQATTGDSLIVLSAALLSEAMSQGQVYLDLHRIGIQNPVLTQHLPETVSDWLERLKQSHMVGSEGEMKPMVLTESGRLYLYRYWHDEQQVTQLVEARLNPMPIRAPDSLRQRFAEWPSSMHDSIDWQKVAVMMALSRQLSVISDRKSVV